MNSQQYAAAAAQTEAKPETLQFSRAGLAMMMAFTVLASDLADMTKRSFAYGKAFDPQAFRDKIDQIGDRLDTLKQRAHMIAVPEDTESPLHLPNLRLAHAGFGMFSEAGEFLEKLLQQMQTGELDLAGVIEETGDTDWFKQIVHNETGVSEEATRIINQEKLQSKSDGRYKSGEWTMAEALNRNLGAERQILEAGAAAATAAANAEQVQEAA